MDRRAHAQDQQQAQAYQDAQETPFCREIRQELTTRLAVASHNEFTLLVAIYFNAGCSPRAIAKDLGIKQAK